MTVRNSMITVRNNISSTAYKYELSLQSLHTGKKSLEFSCMTEFQSWKEREEDATYTTYVKNQQTYHPHASGKYAHTMLSNIVYYFTCIHAEIKVRHYFICCRSGKHRINKGERKTKEVRPHQKESQKLDSTCISRLC